MSGGGPPARPQARTAYRLSLLLPGLGLLYAGAPLRGLAVMVAAWLGLGGIAMGIDHFDRPLYPAYGGIGALLLLVAWWGGARHARAFAASAHSWPPLYRWFARPAVREGFGRARVEIAMAVVFAALSLLHLSARPPRWLPEVPRYWFLYEVLAALYLAVFVAVASASHAAGGGAAARRAAGFLAVTLVATLVIAALARLPKEVLLFAYVLALPSCWFSLRYRGEQAVRLHAARFAVCLFAGFAALLALTVAVEAWSALTGTPQHRIPQMRSENFLLGALGAAYYVVRAGFEAIARKEKGRPEAPSLP